MERLKQIRRFWNTMEAGLIAMDYALLELEDEMAEELSMSEKLDAALELLKATK